MSTEAVGFHTGSCHPIEPDRLTGKFPSQSDLPPGSSLKQQQTRGPM